MSYAFYITLSANLRGPMGHFLPGLLTYYRLYVRHPSWRFNTGFFLKEIISHNQLPLKLILFQGYQVSTFMRPSSGSFVSKNKMGYTLSYPRTKWALHYRIQEQNGLCIIVSKKKWALHYHIQEENGPYVIVYKNKMGYALSFPRKNGLTLSYPRRKWAIHYRIQEQNGLYIIVSKNKMGSALSYPRTKWALHYRIQEQNGLYIM
jgi:hypothetical protein